MAAETPTRGRLSGAAWHEAREREQSARDAAIDRRVKAWLAAERIEAYLPCLLRQREDAARHLRELDALIRDEQAAVAEIRASIK